MTLSGESLCFLKLKPYSSLRLPNPNSRHRVRIVSMGPRLQRRQNRFLWSQWQCRQSLSRRLERTPLIAVIRVTDNSKVVYKQSDASTFQFSQAGHVQTVFPLKHGFWDYGGRQLGPKSGLQSQCPWNSLRMGWNVINVIYRRAGRVANWVDVCQTAGRGRQDEEHLGYVIALKRILLYTIRPDTRKYLQRHGLSNSTWS